MNRVQALKAGYTVCRAPCGPKYVLDPTDKLLIHAEAHLCNKWNLSTIDFTYIGHQDTKWELAQPTLTPGQALDALLQGETVQNKNKDL